VGAGGPGTEFGAGMVRAGVKNAAFSADVLTESSHTLGDGNRIRQSLSFKVYRDSEGRTRREQAVNLKGLAPDANAQQMILISDPVAGVAYSLNVKERTGFKSARAGDMHGPQRPGPAIRGRSADGGERRPEMGGPGRRNDAERNLKFESLGRQAIEGVQAEGRRITLTIPAGQAGNELPINIVVENWFSPELQTTVLSKRSDPRSGDTVTRLTNISRAEPSRTLFDPPSDYRVTESTAGMPHRGERPR
jgi:hypothetical protein